MKFSSRADVAAPVDEKLLAVESMVEAEAFAFRLPGAALMGAWCRSSVSVTRFGNEGQTRGLSPAYFRRTAKQARLGNQPGCS